jgi:glucokinase
VAVSDQVSSGPPLRPWTIGLDLGGTKCVGVLLDHADQVRETVRVPTPEGTAAFIDLLATVAAELLARSPQPVRGAGFGVPGLVTNEGVLRYAPHLPGIVEVDLVGSLRDRLGLHVVIENDNTSAAWAEHVHRVLHGTSSGSMLYVGLGTGIGGGIVSNGQLVRGTHGFAGEIGHHVIAVDGPRCVCGRRGCWELYASGQALRNMMVAEALTVDGRPAVDGHDLRLLLDAGSPPAEDLARRFARSVAIGLTNLVVTLDVDQVVIGGGVVGDAVAAGADGALLGRIREAIATEFGDAADHRPLPTVTAAAHGPLSGAIGAALLARSASPTRTGDAR